jgi:dipeptidyl aminopeptidase/acylaminoacyl peptidase
MRSVRARYRLWSLAAMGPSLAVGVCAWFMLAVGLAPLSHVRAEPSANRSSASAGRSLAQSRPVTVHDLVSVRRVSALSVSPDRKSFVLQLRRADPVTNLIRTRWYAGRVGDAHLIDLGDGGETRLSVAIIGTTDGSLEAPRVEWSPDGHWIAYTLARNGETQVWRSKTDGTLQEQVTHHPADVCDLAWSRDGRSILFSSGMSRVARDARRLEKERTGYRYDEDLFSVSDPMLPGFGAADATCESVTVSVTDVDRRIKRAATASEQEEFQAVIAQRNGGVEEANGAGRNAVVPPVRSMQGTSAWLERTAAHSRFLRLVASLPKLQPDPIGCAAPQCEGLIERVWWNRAGDAIYFWRREGLLGETSAFYSWTPGQPRVSAVWRQPDEFLEACDIAAGDVVVCVRELPTRPAHLIAIDLRSGALSVAADVNHEFADIRLGKVERSEWDTGKFAWNEKGGRLEGLYPQRTFGYMIFPPDFDPSKKYPLFVEPYAGRQDVGSIGPRPQFQQQAGASGSAP